MSGLDGPIDVFHRTSNKYYDFGGGFYCAHEKEPALNLLCPYDAKAYADISLLPEGYADPFLYKLELSCPGVHAASLNGAAWALFVAYNRGAFVSSDCPEFCDSVEAFFEGVDIISGPISDDKTFFVMQMFAEENMTYECLDTVLRKTSTGIQHVVKSQDVADLIRIVETHRISPGECLSVRIESTKAAEKRKQETNALVKKHRKSGLFLSELIEEINAQRIVFPRRQENLRIVDFRM